VDTALHRDLASVLPRAALAADLPELDAKRRAMCGFTGLASSDPRRTPSVDVLTRMTRALQHRGPDDERVVLRDSLGAGFRRLSIIDVGGGHQPIFNEAEDVAIVCNGEIYNFEELRADLERRGHRFRTASDVEVILHLYEERGAECVEPLVGMYAFAVLDWRRKGAPRLLLGRDRIGIKPLYFAHLGGAAPGGEFLFASEPKAILESGFLPRKLRARSLLDYLVTGYCGGRGAAWDGIDRLPPASTLSWSADGGVEIRRYWDLPTDRLRGPAQPDEILEWLDRVVKDHLISDVPLGAFLSGGIDSNAVVESMARARGGIDRASRSLASGLVCCSVGFREKRFDELALASASAERVGATHYTQILEPDPALALEVLPWFFDEPLADPSAVPTYLVSKMAREHVTVAISGDGGDEVFAGYRRYVFDVAENRVRHAIGRPGQRLLALVGRGYPKLDWAPRFLRAKSTLTNFARDPAHAYWNSVTQLSRDDALAVLDGELARSLAEHDPFDAFEDDYRRPSVDDPLYRAQYADFHGFLPDQILVKSDRASMGASLEVRPPLLDHRFVERFANLPAREKVRSGRGKHAFREALRARLAANVLDGPKMGFEIPLRAWLAGPLAPAVGAAIESLPSRWFQRERLRELTAQHSSGLRDHSHLLWSLLVLERWRRRHGVADDLA
jgi:asparagine synthase (glutamine-hydrolysing)